MWANVGMANTSSLKVESDTKYVIMDRLLGFDESEPLDSPYRMGSTSVMDEIEVIPSERVDELTGGQL